MTKYFPVDDLEEQLRNVRPGDSWFDVGGNLCICRASIMGHHQFEFVDGEIRWFGFHGTCISKLEHLPLAGPCAAKWELMPGGGVWAVTNAPSSAQSAPVPVHCFGVHEAIDTGWRTSECRHCHTPMEFVDMHWVAVAARGGAGRDAG